MRLIANLRTNIGTVAAATASTGLILLGSAVPASAATQRLNTGVVDDRDAKLTMVLQKSKSGKPKKVKGLEATNYDLECESLLEPGTTTTVEVDFSFPAMKVKSKRQGKYRYVFEGKADDGDPFSGDFFDHAGVAEGFFATSKSGKLTKLVGYLTMGAFSNNLPGLTPPISCADPVRKKPFEKLHGSFQTAIR